MDNLSKINNLEVINILENATELFQSPKYQSLNYVEKFIGLAINRASFYGRKLGDRVVPLKTSEVIFNESEPVEIVVEGVLLLGQLPVNNGGDLNISGYGVIEVNGTREYDGRDSGGGGGLTDGTYNDITVSGLGTIWTVNPNTITNIKLADMNQNTIKGRVSAGSGDPEDLTATQVRTILNVADGANNYSHPNHTGDVTSTGDGSQTLQSVAITGKTTVTPQGTDEVLISDNSDTGNLKKVTAQSIANLGGVADGDKGDITVSSSGTVWNLDNTAISSKPGATVAGSDLILISDADNLNNLKQVTAQSVADLGVGATDLAEGTTTNTTVVVTSSTGNDATLQPASTSRAGLMSKAKFDEVEVNNAKVSNVSTNLSFGNRTITTCDVISSDGTDATLDSATTSLAGVMSAQDKTKLVALKNAVNFTVSSDNPVSEAILRPTGTTLSGQIISGTRLLSVSYLSSTDDDTYTARATLGDIPNTDVWVKAVAVYQPSQIGTTKIYAEYI